MADERKYAVTRQDLAAVSSLAELGKAFEKIRNAAGHSVRGIAEAAARQYGQKAVGQQVLYAMSQGQQIVRATGELFDDHRIEQFLTVCKIDREAHQFWIAAALRVGAPTTGGRPVPVAAPETPVADTSDPAAPEPAPASDPTAPDSGHPVRRPFRDRVRAVSVPAALGAVGTVLVLLMSIGVYSMQKDWTDASASDPPTAPPVTTTGPQGTPLDTAAPCPSRPEADARPVASISIIAWCDLMTRKPDGTLNVDRWQLKLRPCITNETDGNLDLSITKTADKSSALRLLINAENMPAAWNPGQKTLDAGDKPVRVIWEGHSYWALPPNDRKDYSEVPRLDDNGNWDGVSKGWDGFATFWEDVVLTPENRTLYEPITYHPNGRPVFETDLVFTLPNPDTSKLTVFALALVDPYNPSVVIAVSPPKSSWPPKRWAAEF